MRLTDLTVFGAWVGLIAATGTGCVIVFELTRTIGRLSRPVSMVLSAAIVALLWRFISAGIALPSSTHDWDAAPRIVPAVLLGAAVFGFVAANLPQRRRRSRVPADVRAEPIRHGTTLRADSAGNPAAAVDGDLYVHRAFGLALRGIDSWFVQPFEPRFRDAGGFLAVESPDGSVRINLLASRLDLDFFSTTASATLVEQWKAKSGSSLEDLRLQTRGNPVRQMNLDELDGERRVVQFEFATGKGRVGKVCALHDDREFVAYYTSSNSSPVDVDQVLRSWRWLSADRDATDLAS